MNVDVKLCFKLPFFTKEIENDWRNNKAGRAKNIDKRTDMLATILALYPFTKTEEIAKEFNVSAKSIAVMANLFGIRKSDEFRSDVNRNNATANSDGAKIVEKVSRNGKVVETYLSISDASKVNGIPRNTLSYLCNGRRKNKYINGYRYRFKD